MRSQGTRTSETPDRRWWKEVVVYQRYPRGFNDGSASVDVDSTDAELDSTALSVRLYEAVVYRC